MGQKGTKQLSYESLSPIDERYREEIKDVIPYFSEKRLFELRASVEFSYLSLLMKLGIIDQTELPKPEISVQRIRKIEKKTGHDVKALEIYLREFLIRKGLSKLCPYVHIGLTSEDVNSLSYAIMVEKAKKEVLIPEYSSLALVIAELAEKESNTLMLGRTHGLPALPTTFGKEISFFGKKITERLIQLTKIKPEAKFSGALGTYASFRMLSDKDWPRIMKGFVESFGVHFSDVSKQTSPSDKLADIIYTIININKIMESLCLDLWLYSLVGYISFKSEGKIGSSTMPHKVNPVDIENAEGQAKISNSLLNLILDKIGSTRLQRDLSDSPIRRMIGQGIGHSIIACRRLKKALKNMIVNANKMEQDIRAHPEVLSEAIQIRFRLQGNELGYEKTKKMIDNGTINYDLAGIKQEHYVGFAPQIAKDVSAWIRKELSAFKDP